MQKKSKIKVKNKQLGHIRLGLRKEKVEDKEKKIKTEEKRKQRAKRGHESNE